MMGINPMTFQTAAMQATARAGSPRRASTGRKRRAKAPKARKARRTKRVKKAAGKKARKFVKGSAQAKAFMAKLRRMQKRK